MIFEGNLPICPPTALATTIVRFAKEHPKKTVLASMMSGDDGESGRKLLYRTGVPCTVNPDDASRLFATMWKYRKIVDAAHAPCPPAVGAMTHDQLLEAVDKAEAILQRVRATGRTVLTEAESKEVLKAHGIPVAETVAAKTEDEAVAAAERMGFPVVVKLLSETITHKSDVGGVILNVQGPSQVRAAFKSIQESLSAKFGQAKVATLFDGVTVQPMLDLATSYELLLGSSADPQFGPVICFGTGGKLVEVFRDRALALPPLSTPMAKSLIAKTKISKALAGTRGQPPVDNERLVSILVAFSNMISHHPLIKEADVNPLLASSKRISAVDARIVLYPASDPHIPALALAPYPLRHVLKASVPGVGQVVVRPLVPEDEEMWTQFTGKQESRAGVIDALFSSFAYSTVLAAVAPGNKIVATARIAKIGMGVSEGSFAVQAPPEVLESETLTVLVKHALDVARTEGFSSLSTAPEQAKLLAKFGFGNGKLSLQ
jgi:acetyltransferase